MVRSAAFALVALCAPLVGPSRPQPTTLRIEALSRRTVRVLVSGFGAVRVELFDGRVSVTQPLVSEDGTSQ